MKAFCALFLILFSASTFASTAHLTGAPIPIPPVKPPPPPPKGSTFPHYLYWRPMYDNGTTISNEYVRGEWIVTGRATTTACAMLFKDAGDEKGLKNKDGSDWVSLTFTDFPSENGPMFGVKINNMGSNAKENQQGPYELAPQEPQFATWSFKTIPPSTGPYYEYSCRGTSDSKNLVCVLSLQNVSPIDTSDEYVRCSQSPEATILVYSRK